MLHELTLFPSPYETVGIYSNGPCRSGQWTCSLLCLQLLCTATVNNALTFQVRAETETDHETFVSERNSKTRSLLSTAYCHNISNKFTGWTTGRGLNGVGDKMGIFIGIFSATKNVTPLTPMESEDHLNRITENQRRLHYTVNWLMTFIFRIK